MLARPLSVTIELAGLLQECLHRNGERAPAAARDDHVGCSRKRRELDQEAEGIE